MSNNHPRTIVRPTNSGTATPTTTQTITQTAAGPSIPINAHTLRLRAEPEERRHIQWSDDVIDNEGMGKKKSKVCCIYHKPHEPGDSESEDSDTSSSESDSDSEPDLSRARRAGGGKGKGRGRKHHHEHDGGSGDGGDGKGKASERKASERKASPNAYERQPRQKSKKEG